MTKDTQSFSSFIRPIDGTDFFELIGCEHITKTDIGGGRTEYIERQVRITGGSRSHCKEVEKNMFPEKYF